MIVHYYAAIAHFCTAISTIMIFSISLAFTAAEPLELILYHGHKVKVALDVLEATGREYTKVLAVGRYDPQQQQQ